MLSTSYARILKGTSAGAAERQMAEPVAEEDECMIPKRNDIIEDLEGKPTRVANEPRDCGETLCEGADGVR